MNSNANEGMTLLAADVVMEAVSSGRLEEGQPAAVIVARYVLTAESNLEATCQHLADDLTKLAQSHPAYVGSDNIQAFMVTAKGHPESDGTIPQEMKDQAKDFLRRFTADMGFPLPNERIDDIVERASLEAAAEMGGPSVSEKPVDVDEFLDKLHAVLWFEPFAEG